MVKNDFVTFQFYTQNQTLRRFLKANVHRCIFSLQTKHSDGGRHRRGYKLEEVFGILPVRPFIVLFSSPRLLEIFIKQRESNHRNE